MASEPRLNMKCISARIPLEDYFKVRNKMRRTGVVDFATYIRSVVHADIQGEELADGDGAEIEREVRANAQKRSKARGMLRSFIRRVVGR